MVTNHNNNTMITTVSQVITTLHCHLKQENKIEWCFPN